MTDLTEAQMMQLEKERQEGSVHQSAWDKTVEPFFALKEKQLFEAFKELGVSNEKALIMIHMQFNVLNAMKDHFQHYIDTGRMAEVTLNENLH